MSPPPSPFIRLVVNVPQTDRWLIRQRLQELMIPCWCPPDGSLRVEVSGSTAAILLRSTVWQFLASRTELADWLERCWPTPPVPSQFE